MNIEQATGIIAITGTDASDKIETKDQKSD